MKKIVLISHFVMFSLVALSQPCLPDGITFSTQSQIDNFQINYPGCTEIEGDVIIRGADIFNLNGLIVLVSIGGNLDIGDSQFTNPLLDSLAGLDNLTSIGGSLFIRSNSALNSLAGLEGLTSVEDDVSIWYNTTLNSLMGLEGLISIGGGLDISGLFGLTDLSGLENLTSINGDLHIYNNSLSSLAGLDNLQPSSIVGLTIIYNENLSNCEAEWLCDYLDSPNGSVDIYDNAGNCNNPSQIADGCGISLPCLPFGNYHFLYQTEIDNFQIDFQNCTDLTGNVRITGNDITNLNGLSIVNTIAGDLSIANNDRLTDLSGLDSLVYIGGSMRIDYNDSIQSLTGLEGLTSIDSNVSIYRNGFPSGGFLNDLTGLNNLNSIGGNFMVDLNPSLLDLSGLESLTQIGGDFVLGGDNDQFVVGNWSLKDITSLGNLAYIGGDLIIMGNDSLSSLSGLENILALDHELMVFQNNSLINFQGLQNITMIGGDLDIDYNNNLINLNGLESLQLIGGRLRIGGYWGNPSLYSLAGLEGIDSIGGNLLISNNDSLCDCAIPALCDYLSNPGGTVEIYNNEIGCNNPAEIADSCGFTMPCLPFGNYHFTCQEDIDYFQDDYPGCTELNGDVEIFGGNINNLNGLGLVTSIEEFLWIHENDSLASLSGLENLASIGYISIWNNDILSDISSLEGLTSLSLGYINIYYNDMLTNLNGLENIDAGSIDGLYISNNITLSECAVKSICDYLIAPNGIIVIHENAPGCNSQQEVEEVCGVGMEESAVVSHLSPINIYPNPFTTSITISYTLDSPENIRFTVYNVQSQIVYTMEEWRERGEQHLQWNADGLPAGLYYFRIQTGEKVGGGKMVKME